MEEALNIPAMLAATNTVVALLAALLTARIAAGPGWRELRYFSFSALCAAIFSFASVPLSLPMSDAQLLWASRITFCAASLHAVGWIVYYAAQHKRRLRRIERALFHVGLVGAAASLVPGALIEPTILARRVEWLGVTYRDGVPTHLGQIFMAYYCFVIVFLAAGYLRRWRRGAPSAGPPALGLTFVFLCAVNDAIAATGRSSTPYLLDVGFTVLVLAVGLAVTARFVANARALDESTQRLAETQRELVVRERLAAIGELSAVVAHEVRNPLAVIFNAVAGLKKLALGEEERVLTGILEEEADRLNRIVAELLEFARPRDARFQGVEVEPLFARAVDAALQATHRTEPVEIHVEAGVGRVRCDAELLRQAIINLVTNALLANQRRSPVRVYIEAEADRTLRVTVSDDGEGIPDAILDRIFLPFFTTRPTGTGLGLPIVRRVAEAHGGTVTYEPTAGGGATFVLRLPVREESGTRRVA